MTLYWRLRLRYRMMVLQFSCWVLETLLNERDVARVSASGVWSTFLGRFTEMTAPLMRLGSESKQETAQRNA